VENVQGGWKKSLKKLSKQARLTANPMKIVLQAATAFKL
jgi:hypothetical protein